LQVFDRRRERAHFLVVDGHGSARLDALAQALVTLGAQLIKPGLIRPLADALAQELDRALILPRRAQGTDHRQGYTQTLGPARPGRLCLRQGLVDTLLLDG